ncbi:MAG: acetyl-coenzyme A synthetase, partial [Candidatus Puniceispirillum sp. TMED52]
MSEHHQFPPSDARAKSALVDNATYLDMYKRSIEQPDAFWDDMGRQQIDWMKPYTKVNNSTYDAASLSIKWYEDGTLNASANCLDRHLATRGDQTALIFEGDDPSVSRHISYRELHDEVCRFANVLKARG